MREVTENITKITYEGNCPSCGKLQTSLRKGNTVDAICFECRQKERKLSETMMLAGAVVESVEYMNNDIYKIIIVSPDGTRGVITTMYDSSTMDYTVGDVD